MTDEKKIDDVIATSLEEVFSHGAFSIEIDLHDCKAMITIEKPEIFVLYVKHFDTIIYRTASEITNFEHILNLSEAMAKKYTEKYREASKKANALIQLAVKFEADLKKSKKVGQEK